MDDLLSQRRQWFSYFPEGTLEFLVVTRVLALMLLAVLIIVPASQRSVVLTAMAGVLWLDYALLIWWLVHLAADLEEVFEPGGSSSTIAGSGVPKGRMRDSLIVLAPSVLALLAVAPWPGVVLGRTMERGHRTLIVHLLFSLLFLAALPVAYHRLRTITRLSGTWAGLLLLPIVHWLAVNRLLGFLHRRVRDRALQQNLPVARDAGPGTAAAASTVFAIVVVALCTLWSLLITRGRSGGVLMTLVQIVAIGAGCLFAITQLAALEYLQRRFVALLRRSEPQSTPSKATETAG